MKDVVKNVILDDQERKEYFIDEKKYQKIKNKMNKTNDYFNIEDIKLLYKLR